MRVARVGWRRYLNGVNFGVVVVILFVMLPIYWLVISSLKQPAALGATPPQFFPNPLSLTNYRDAFSTYGFGVYFRNSVVVTIATTILVLFFGSLAGYGLGRLPMRGKSTILITLLIISLFPGIAVVPPLYLLERTVGILNSYQALIIPYTAFNLPFAIWILRNYFQGIPKEMEETGRIDGASPWRIYWSIVMPQALPGLFTAGVFTFTAAWTEFLMALTFNNSNSFRTIPVGIALFGTPFNIPYGTIFAASVVAVIPIGILVFVFRKSVVSGLTSGSVKG
ncbi:MAG: carbohydrate ABC transporter permease [Actinomycetota bacterium]|jgi:multiple sugar transport system permease protein|nr:carbohydrate ABC transporter permease [Actinomycetota bacterium]